MIRFRLAVALTMITGMAGLAQSAPIQNPEAEVMDRLAPVFATRDPVRITMAFRAMGEYGRPAADIVESSINAMGYDRLENGDIDEAIAIFDLNADTFPTSANTWDSLAEACMSKGENDTAIRYYQRSLEIDPDNSNALQMIEELAGEQQVSHASAE